MRIGILTVSDACSRRERADLSGDAIASWARKRGYVVAAREVVPDERALIASRLVEWCDADAADVVLTTGGTGLSPRDVTPEATGAVLQREAPGIAERLRWTAMAAFPRAALSRGLAGVRAKTLVINLPGSPGGVRDGLTSLEPIVDHAVQILRGLPADHGAPGSQSDIAHPA